MKRSGLLIALLLAGCQPTPGLTGLGGLGTPSFVLSQAGDADVAASVPVVPASTAAPSRPTSAPTPAPTPPPSGGGGSWSAPAPAAPTGPVVGRVLGLGSPGELPVAAARVTLSDGRDTLTDGEGNFTFDGPPPADGAYTVSHPSYRASTVLGLTDATVTLHLQPRTDVLAASDAPAVTTFTVSGRVQDDQGQPLEGAQLVLRDPRGSLGLLADAAADGTFTMTVQGVGGSVVNGTMLIRASKAGATYLADVGGLSLAPGQAPLTPFRVAPAPHTLHVAVSGPSLPGTPRITVTAVGPNGERLTCPVDGDAAQVASIAGVRYSLDVASRDNDRGLATVLHKEAIAPAFGQPATTLRADLLGLPTVAPGFSLAAGATLSWAAVAGAAGYAVDVASEDAQAVPWSAFSASPSLTVPATVVPQGPARLTVTAWDQAGLSTRTVAAVGLAGFRTLPLAPATEYRRSTCQLSKP